MKELLEEFVELAPKEWGAEWCGLGNEVGIYGLEARYSMAVPVINLKYDARSALALIHLLNWLEGQGYFASVAPHEWPDGKVVTLYECRSRWNGRVRATGKTRIEAVVRACVAVLKEGEGSA